MARPAKDPDERRVRRDYRFSPETLKILREQEGEETQFVERAIQNVGKEKNVVVTPLQIAIGDVQLEPAQALEILQTLYSSRDLLLKRALGISPFSQLRLECPSCRSRQLVEVDTESDGYYLGCPSCGNDAFLNFRGEFIKKEDE